MEEKQFLDKNGLKQLMELSLGRDSAGEAISLENKDHHTIISVKYDDDTIVLNSEGELSLTLDDKHLFVNSEGKLSTKDLATAGGTMTGNIKLKNTANITAAEEDQWVNVMGGVNYQKGATITLFGDDGTMQLHAALSISEGADYHFLNDGAISVCKFGDSDKHVLTGYNTYVVPNSEGTSKEKLKYITIDGVQYKVGVDDTGSEGYLKLSGGEMTGRITDTNDDGVIIEGTGNRHEDVIILGGKGDLYYSGAALYLEPVADGGKASIVTNDGSLNSEGYPANLNEYSFGTDGRITVHSGDKESNVLTGFNTYAVGSEGTSTKYLDYLVLDNKEYKVTGDGKYLPLKGGTMDTGATIDVNKGYLTNVREISGYHWTTSVNAYKLKLSNGDNRNTIEIGDVSSGISINSNDGNVQTDSLLIRRASGSSTFTYNGNNILHAGNTYVVPSSEGTSSEGLKYITINGKQYKVSGDYLPIKGGTMLGNIKMDSGRGITSGDMGTYISASNSSNSNSIISVSPSELYAFKENSSGSVKVSVNDDSSITIRDYVASTSTAKDYNVLTGKNTYAVSDSEGTSTKKLKYLTIDGVEYKLAGDDSSEGNFIPLDGTKTGKNLTGTIVADTQMAYSGKPVISGDSTSVGFLLSCKPSQTDLDNSSLLLTTGNATIYAVKDEPDSEGDAIYYSYMFRDSGKVKVETNDPSKGDDDSAYMLTEWNTFVSSEGTSTKEIKYITIADEEYKIGGGNYLPLAGGTMDKNATITFQGQYSNQAIRVNNLTSQLSFMAAPGTNTSDQGASLTLEGPDSGGRAFLTAVTDYYNKAYLTLNPSGEIVEDIYSSGRSKSCNVLTGKNTYYVASSEGTSTTALSYLTLDGVQYKIKDSTDYIPMSGTPTGKYVTGQIRLSNVTGPNGGLIGNITMSNTSDTLVLCGGTKADDGPSQGNGSYISLSGKDASGDVQIIANNGSNSLGLYLDPTKTEYDCIYTYYKGGVYKVLTGYNTRASATGTSTTEVKYLTIGGTQYKLAGGSKVTVSSEGTSTTEAKYITVDNTEYKLAGGIAYDSASTSTTFTIGKDSTGYYISE